jgi:hypothetical protein
MPPREVDQLIEALLDFSELVARLYAAAFFMVTAWRCPIESSVTSGVSYGVTGPGDPLKQRFSFGATYSGRATRRFLVSPLAVAEDVSSTGILPTVNGMQSSEGVLRPLLRAKACDVLNFLSAG